MEAHDKPLNGLKIVDFSAVFAGPICTRLMSDCGADVIKVEPPVGGDVIRGPFGRSRLFAHFNAGKKCVALDLAKSKGQELARELISEADVVVENYRPGIMSKFGLDYASLKDDFPGLVYRSISGFGQTGPHVHRAAYAPVAHAASGFDHVHQHDQIDAEAPPPVWGIMVADMLTGSYAHGAILTAMLGRERHGRGEYIDVTMLESMMMLIPSQIQFAQVENPPPTAGFRPIQCKDGFVMVCIVSGKNLKCLAETIGKPELVEDERFQLGNRNKHQDAFFGEVESFTSRYTVDEAEQLLNDGGVPCSRYNSPSDLFSHPQLTERSSFKQFEDDTSTFLIQNAPYLLNGCDISTTPTNPALGEHTLEIFSKNWDQATLDNWRAEGVVGFPD